MLRVIGNDQNLPRQEHAVASGTLPNGKPVVVNSDGTVSVVGPVSVLDSTGTPVVFENANIGKSSTVYDSTSQKVIITYRDDGNSFYGTAIVGTVSGTSISFGSPVVFASAFIDFNVAIYDANSNKIVIAYEDLDNSSYGTAIVGTVSGTSISFGSSVVFESATVDYISATYDTTSQKAIITYRDDGNNQYGTCIVGTVSGTSISFGSPTVFESATIFHTSTTYDVNAQKVVIAYRDSGNSNYGTAIVGTVSGTSISFGSPVVFNSGTTVNTSTAYDANAQKVVIAYKDSGNLSYGTVIVGTVSGTSISFGTEVVFNSTNTGQHAIVYDSNSNKIVIGYTSTSNRSVIVGTVSGTSISFGSPVNFGDQNILYISAAYDASAQKVVIAYRDNSNSNYGTAVIFQVASTSNNITSENYIGIARSGAASGAGAIIDTQGAINTSLTSAIGALNEATYSNKSFSLSSQISKAHDIFFKPDGSIMYALDNENTNTIYQYTLSTAWDISTASYASKSLNVNSIDTNLLSMFIRDNGQDLYWIGAQQDTLYQYALSTPWDLSTASQTRSQSVSSQIGYGGGLFFKSDGSKVYINDMGSSGYIRQFSLSTPWNISTISYDSVQYNWNNDDSNMTGIWFSSDGLKMYGTGFTNDKIYQYTLGSAWSLASVTDDNVELSVGGQETAPRGFFIKDDDLSQIFVVGSSQDTVFEYSPQVTLTAGQSYYVQTDGTISTTADDPSVFAGTAVSATELIVKG